MEKSFGKRREAALRMRFCRMLIKCADNERGVSGLITDSRLL